jgi:hypothetical protein
MGKGKGIEQWIRKVVDTMLEFDPQRERDKYINKPIRRY